MRLTIREIHAAATKTALNDEWFVVENTSDKAFSASGCAVQVGRGKGRLRTIGTLDPGFTLQPGERIRVVTGNSGKKAHGPAPTGTGEGEPKNYHLFQMEPLLAGPGSTIALAWKQLEVARASFDPETKEGVGAESAS